MPTASADQALCLEVLDFEDADHWRWCLTDAGGKYLESHEVRLDRAEAEYAAFVDLQGYLRNHAAPDEGQQDEARLLEEVGAWIARRILGPIAIRLASVPTPATVRVVLPENGAFLLERPLELAHVSGRPLSLQDISLVHEVKGEAPAVAHRPIGAWLRLLAVFSLPTDASALALRRERHQLSQLIEELVQTRGLAIELRVVQYGVTRQALKEVLTEAEGWDILHFSGHGLTGGVLLEKPDGSRDLVTADELVALVRAARGQLKLVTLSSCLSAAARIDETLHWLGIRHLTPALPAEDGEAAIAPSKSLPAVARVLVRDLDCAVLAMRYPVGDDFAIDLCTDLYKRLFADRQPLSRALQLALPEALGTGTALGDGSRPGVPPLSVATPALFGRAAVDLSLSPPSALAIDHTAPITGLAVAGFPPEPERFVGRVGPMSRASVALAPRSGKTVVLFHGMAGAGKTSCALELAYRHENQYDTGRFPAFVWYKAPDASGAADAEGVEKPDVEGALLTLALQMEQGIPNFKMVHVVDRADEFTAFQPRLRQLLQQRSILIVLDNLESLLTSKGEWLDPRWGVLMATLLEHRGLSRTVLTSRVVPAELKAHTSVQLEPIHALSLSEAAVLARELPNLGRLMRGESPAGVARGRELVARTLSVVQGHPKLVELAEGQAADPDTLATHLDRAAPAWSGDESRLEHFFREGTSSFGAEEFLDALSLWTRGAAAGLPDAARTLFHFICALEEGDRQRSVVAADWADLWRRLERPGDAPELDATLSPLRAAGLVDVRSVGADQCVYDVHPGVAETGRYDADATFHGTVDTLLAELWIAVFQRGRDREQGGGGEKVARAGLSAVPYLMRQKQWDMASGLIEQALNRDASPSTIASVLPLLRHIVTATADTPSESAVAGLLARALYQAGRLTEAEALLKEVVRRTTEREQFFVLSGAMGYLIRLLRDTGRGKEALPLIEEKKQATAKAGLGPWTQLADEGQRLQLLNELGEHDSVLSAVDHLRGQMDALPEQDERHKEGVHPWRVRETILDVGRSAASRLEHWNAALALNADVVASQQARGATSLETARTRFNDYRALLRLHRDADARTLLYDVRSTCERSGATGDLGRVFVALADLEGNHNNLSAALTFVQAALRYTYLAGNPEPCAISHNNLSSYLRRAGAQREAIITHRLAAVLINYQTWSGDLHPYLRNLRNDLAAHPTGEHTVPASFDALCQIVEQVEGVRFRELFERLPQRAASGDEALRAVLVLAEQVGEDGAVPLIEDAPSGAAGL